MNHIYSIFSAIVLLVLLVSNKGGRAFQENEGSTGAPGEPVYCKNCHNANIVVAVDIFVIDGKDTVKTYIPEKNYNVHVVIRPTGGPAPKGYGFQLVGLIAPNKQSGPDIKTLTAGSQNVKTATTTSTKRLYAEHNGNSSTSTFIVNWQAPALGSGPVTFYAAGMGNNANNDSSGDGAAKNSLQLNEKVTTATIHDKAKTDLQVFPNPGPGLFYCSGFDSDKIKSLSVFDLMGKPVCNREFNQTPCIDLTEQQDGIYFVQWKDLNGNVLRTSKLIKRTDRP